MDTRNRILSVSREEFARYGLAGARVDRIARKSRVNKAMIYYHFQSKERLYQAVIDYHVGKIGAFLENTMVPDTDAEAFFLELAKFYGSMIQPRDKFLPIILREIAGGGLRIRESLTKIISEKGTARMLKKLIDDGIKSGRFRQINSMQAMISFFGMNLFYLFLAPTLNSVWEIRDEKSFRRKRPTEVVDLFLYGIKAR
jgi:AcrR family transcriptional regulator